MSNLSHLLHTHILYDADQGTSMEYLEGDDRTRCHRVCQLPVFFALRALGKLLGVPRIDVRPC